MSQSNKKILVSGCGMSWGQQQHRTWVNILQSLGLNIIDVSGPAISNQTILNRAFDRILCDNISKLVVQLTLTGKLDVEINNERQHVLVDPDSLRNFTHQGLWPSSHSQEHESKQLWYKWLYSPNQEIIELYQKIILLNHWCYTHGIDLILLQGYQIDWQTSQTHTLSNLIVNFDCPLYQVYLDSPSYQYHDHKNYNTVPCIDFQIEIANIVLKQMNIDMSKKLNKIRQHYR